MTGAAAALGRLVDWILRAEVIDGGGTGATHFKRWCLGALPNGRRLYLHHFVGSDMWRDLHDHPKAFLSIGLLGGYVEEVSYFTTSDGQPMRTLKRRRWVAPWFRRFDATHTHRLRIAPGRPCWTLVVTGPYRRAWGFWSADGWVYWQRYLRERGGHA